MSHELAVLCVVAMVSSAACFDLNPVPSVEGVPDAAVRIDARTSFPPDAPSSLPPDAPPATGPAPPYVTSYSPYASVKWDASLTPTISATFNEEVFQLSSASFRLYRIEVDSWSEAVEIDVAATVTYTPQDGARLVPSLPLLYRSWYLVALNPNKTKAVDKIRNADGHGLAQKTFIFYTIDGPQIWSQTPAPDAVNVPRNTPVRVQFTEDVCGVSSTSFMLSSTNGIVTYDATTYTASLMPTALLAPATTYEVTLTNPIMDSSGNPLRAPPVTCRFTTTNDATAPTVASSSPAAGARDVATTSSIVVVFDEPVLNVTGATFQVTSTSGAVGGTITRALGGTEFTFTPTALPSGSRITVTLTAGITDVGGTPMVPATLSFRTAN